MKEKRLKKREIIDYALNKKCRQPQDAKIE